jgi:subtilisin family serine protease
MPWKKLGDRQNLSIGLWFAVIAFVVVAFVAGGSLITPPTPPTPTSTGDPLMMKTDSVFLDLIQAYRLGGIEDAERFARERDMITKDGRVRLTLVLDTEDPTTTAAKLGELGATVEVSHKNLITMSAPFSLILRAAEDVTKPGFFDDLAGLKHVVDIRVPSKSVVDGADPKSQGVAVSGANRWQAAGFTGKGVKIGILDAGFAGYESLLGIALPQRVTVRSFTFDGDITGEGEEHGTAVAEIIHEMAPDAELFFTNADSEAGWLEAVDWLMSQGVRIISQSMGDADSPLDGTGTKGKRIDEVKAKGVLWVNSSGNYAQAHYAATMKPDADGWHEFAEGKNRLRVVADDSGWLWLTLNWRDWQSRTVDYDLYLFNGRGEPTASSRSVQIGNKTPVEELYIQVQKGEGYTVGIKAKDPQKTVAFDLFNFGGLLELATAKGSINAYSSARGALAVGASSWKTDKLEPYSSQGPTWDGRMKPEVCAPAGVASLVYDSGFFGTSSSAPHVAGAAALILQANPAYTPDQLVQYIEHNAVDLGSIGLTIRDSRFGYGRLWLGPPPKGQ